MMRPTGKELFESDNTLIQSDANFVASLVTQVSGGTGDGEPPAAPEAGETKVPIDESLFAGDDDLDLDELDDLEDSNDGEGDI